MKRIVWHVRKVSVGLKRKYRIYADDGTGRPGATVGYAEKLLKASNEIILYRDGERTETLATVRESSEGFLAALTGYEVIGAEQNRLGSFGVQWRTSIRTTTWHLEQAGVSQAIGTERSANVAGVRRLIGLFGGAAGEITNALMKYHFDFRRDGQIAFSIEKPKIFDDWYRITAHTDSVERLLVIALAITMEARQRG